MHPQGSGQSRRGAGLEPGPREGAGGVYVVTRKKRTTQTHVRPDSWAVPSVSPLKALLGLPSKPGWMGASSCLVSPEHTCSSVCLSLLGLILVRVCVCACVCESLSHVQLFATPWSVAHQAPLSVEFSRQEYWSGLPFPSPEELPDPGMDAGLLHCRQILARAGH